MPATSHRTDFLALISVCGANPNGDPCRGGVPRTDNFGHGIISPVCIKRKLRDRLEEMGENILISPPKFRGDSVADRVRSHSTTVNTAETACAGWYDVRAFGQVFAFPGVYIPGIKGAVTIQQVESLQPIKINQTGITRCISYTESGKKNSIGFINTVEHGLYVLKGSVNAYTAMKNGFSYEDCEKLRTALLHIFDNDCSAARPAGSMELKRLYWWEHSGVLGDYSPARVFGTVKAKPLTNKPVRFEDYEIIHSTLPGLEPKIFEG